jgi:predicted phage terminase large subunit-like protein
MKRISFEDKELVKTCRELYIKYGGKKHRQIELELRRAGWPEFNRRIFYSNVVRGVEYANWIERFGWKHELERLSREAAERESGRTTFEDWLQAEPSGWKWTARHHAFICGHLRHVTEGASKRLMIFVPPRHGKSELVTVRYIAWRLIRDARMNVIIGCYNQKLANRFSRKIKQITTGRVVRSHARHAAEEWETAAGGSVKAVGVGSGITGFGGDLVVIDDPIKGRAEARSAVLREKIWDWYKDDISTRLEPNAPIILIQTRWHDDDLAGRLLKEMENGGEKWEVVRLPALAESEPPALAGGRFVSQAASPLPADGSDPHTPIDAVSVPANWPPAYAGGSDWRPVPANWPPAYAGGSDWRSEGEALWPERYDRDDLLATKRRLGPWSFSALYQQRPVPAGGTLFKPEWFRNVVSNRPEGLVWCRGYDLAVSLKDSADYTASFRIAVDKKTGVMYIADGFRARLEFPEQRRFVIERMLAEPDTRHGIELALHGRALMQELRREPRIRGRVLRGVKVDGDKLLRAEAWAGFAEEGKVVLVNGPWTHDFIDEVCRFTGRGDAHDDQVDAVGLAVQMLNSGKSVEFFD